MKRVLILGTGTNVGKTHVACALARSLQRLEPGIPVACLKPIESGFDAEHSDAARLAAVSVGTALPTPHPFLALPLALSPHLANRLAGHKNIDVLSVAQWLRRWTETTGHRASAGYSIIESAGALFSPLAPGVTNFELARALEPALWVLVAPDVLGVLHDVTTTLAACRQRGRTPDLVVLSAARSDTSTGTNAAELATLGIAEVTDVLGRDVTFAEGLARAVLARA